MKAFLRIAALAVSLALVFCTLPASAVIAADYDQHDVSKLRAFFEYQGDTAPYTNGRAINGEGYDPSSPSTWTSCSWTEGGKLYSISFDNLGWAVSGTLDLSGCGELTVVSGTDCYLDGADLSDCASLTTVNLTGNRMTVLDVSGCHALDLLWFKQNRVTGITLDGFPLLRSLDCSYNQLTALDVSGCPQLQVLRCTNNEIASLDVSRCPLLRELNCKTNLIPTLDISALAQLELLYCFNNRLRMLDISVLNGGNRLILSAVGNGYVGVKSLINSSAEVDYYASENAAEGESFLGWYSNGELITESENMPLTLGQAAEYCAHFTGESAGMLGDVDADGTVSPADALIMLRFVMGLTGADGIHLEVGDVNGDGNYSPEDALLILRYSMGIIDTF
ncbi:MAG: leucine-rich repeat domain-containing protein [Clostridia bacterium]|nr:leucine-rich repeat domain-containing protein [Clostridia bacterium]